MSEVLALCSVFWQFKVDTLKMVDPYARPRIFWYESHWCSSQFSFQSPGTCFSLRVWLARALGVEDMEVAEVLGICWQTTSANPQALRNFPDFPQNFTAKNLGLLNVSASRVWFCREFLCRASARTAKTTPSECESRLKHGESLQNKITRYLSSQLLELCVFF